jgi:hypothetical protein
MTTVFMSDGERVQTVISDWLERNYPESFTWYDRVNQQIPLAIEIRIIPAFGAVEYNICNGGWAQFLWNCFPYWRAIIADAKEGYLLIGAPEQSAALDILYALCERDEKECAETIEKSMKDRLDRWGSYFSGFTSRSGSAAGDRWEELFWGDALYEKRLAWLAANEARVRAAMGLD